MELGMVGLGRMGANMVRRLIRNGHKCVVFDRSPKAVNELVGEGAVVFEHFADDAFGADVFLADPGVAVGEEVEGGVDEFAAGFGVFIAGLFALWPLAMARETPPTNLFRHLLVTKRWPLGVIPRPRPICSCGPDSSSPRSCSASTSSSTG